MANNSKSIVGIASCGDYEIESVISSVRSLLGLLGGVEHFVKPGFRVLLKPNMLSPRLPEKAVTTHPAVLEAVSHLVREAGGRPFFGDSPGIYSPEHVARTAGYNRLGLSLGDFKNTYEVSFPEGYLCKSFSLAHALREADLIINLPKLKTHGQMIMTCAVKNIFGCIPGFRKSQFHLKMQKKEHFAMMLLDLYRCVKPALSIVDAVVAMEGNGPGGGDPRKLGFLAASSDAVALDTVCADIIGLDPLSIPYLKIAHDKKCGATLLENIEIIGDHQDRFKLSDFKIPGILTDMSFNVPVPNWILRRWLTPQPVINKKQCKKCHECVKICPAQPKALSASDGKTPLFNYSHCIRCFCCQEICPHAAMSIKPSLFSRFIG